MVWYVRKHNHKENLGTLGSVLERLEAFGKYLNQFGAFLERMGAFGRLCRLGRLGKHNPIWYVCMVWYGKYVSIITKNKTLSGIRTAALSPIYIIWFY